MTHSTLVKHALNMPIAHELALPTHPETHATPDETNTFYFVRHGATEPNLLELRCGGDLNLPMTALGCEQALASALRIQALKIDIGVLICSRLRRTRQHAEIISGVLGGVPILVDPWLDERCMGRWNMQSVVATEPLLARGAAPPGGESEQAFVARVSEMFERFAILLPLHPLIVSSKAVARVLNLLLGGTGRLTLDNGELIRFVMPPSASPMANKWDPK